MNPRTHAEAISPSDRALIAEFIARRGVTVCPPCTYSEGAFDPKPWREQPKDKRRHPRLGQQSAASAAIDARIMDMVREGKTAPQIAGAVGLDARAVHQRLHRAGWTMGELKAVANGDAA